MVSVGLPATGSGSSTRPSGLMTRRWSTRPVGRLGLGLGVDGLLRLDLLDLVLEHLARAVLVYPGSRVVEHSRRGAVHVVAGLLPRHVVADDRPSVGAVRLEVGGSFEQDRLPREARRCSRPSEGPRPARAAAPPCRPWRTPGRRGESAPGRPAGCLARAFAISPVGCGRIARARQHVGDRVSHFLPVGPPLSEPIELGQAHLVVVARQGAVELDFGVGVELLDARGHVVRLCSRAVLVERPRGRPAARPRRRGSAAARSARARTCSPRQPRRP